MSSGFVVISWAKKRSNHSERISSVSGFSGSGASRRSLRMARLAVASPWGTDQPTCFIRCSTPSCLRKVMTVEREFETEDLTSRPGTDALQPVPK